MKLTSLRVIKNTIPNTLMGVILDNEGNWKLIVHMAGAIMKTKQQRMRRQLGLDEENTMDVLIAVPLCSLDRRGDVLVSRSMTQRPFKIFLP